MPNGKGRVSVNLSQDQTEQILAIIGDPEEGSILSAAVESLTVSLHNARERERQAKELPDYISTRTRKPLLTFNLGQQVCVYGWGSSAGTHAHPLVVRQTKTLVISRAHGEQRERRHRRSDGVSTGFSDTGFTRIAAECQAERQANAGKLTS
jgi:hypothetical protein